MIGLLGRIFIGTDKYKDYKDTSVRRAYGMICSIWGIFLNLCMFAGKYAAGLLSGSISIVADGFNSLADAGTSIVAFFGAWYSGKKPDADHPFGHRRFEYISGLIISMVILMTGFELLHSSIDKIIHPAEPEVSFFIIGILCASILVKGYIWYYNNAIGKKISSLSMHTMSLDSIFDCISTTVVLVSLIVGVMTGFNLDGFIGVIVSFLIMYTGAETAWEMISILIGKRPDIEYVSQIKKIVLSYEDVFGVHDVIVHDYGPEKRMVTLHAEVNGEKGLYVLHDMIDTIEKELDEKLGCSALIHMDPVMECSPQQERLKSEITEFVKTIDSRMKIHDYRVVGRTNGDELEFDVEVPYDVKMRDEDIMEKIKALAAKDISGYRLCIRVDRTDITDADTGKEKKE